MSIAAASSQTSARSCLRLGRQGGNLKLQGPPRRLAQDGYHAISMFGPGWVTLMRSSAHSLTCSCLTALQVPLPSKFVTCDPGSRVSEWINYSPADRSSVATAFTCGCRDESCHPRHSGSRHLSNFGAAAPTSAPRRMSFCAHSVQPFDASAHS